MEGNNGTRTLPPWETLDVAALFFTLFELTEKLSIAIVHGSISVSLISFNRTLVNKVI